MLEKTHPKLYKYRFKEHYIKSVATYFLDGAGTRLNQLLFKGGHNSEDELGHLRIGSGADLGQARPATPAEENYLDLKFVENEYYTIYTLADVIGEGQFGCVRKGQNEDTKHKVAVKIISKAKLLNPSALSYILEIKEYLRKLDSPYILETYDVFRD